ncbi:MAG: DUF429 domain-containing protein [Alphaproteobacteria bacterium]|nr:MAG: DUF429 domain-containing protein [Alphaproteobacteria bacterium]
MLNIVGTPWRGSLRATINNARTSYDWVTRLFDLCKIALPQEAAFTLAIDTPLGFPDAFMALANGLKHVDSIGDSSTNPYLYRHTERALFNGKKGPLSAIKDMIGSQATKGMHVLAKFAPQIKRCGVWSDGGALTVIETYPAAACRRDTPDREAIDALPVLAHTDLNDARICALVAHLFATHQDAFLQPPADVPIREGWIWVPKQGAM